MPLQPPKLDSRDDFKSLFREARDRIPRYIPEWTDWNESDPGITLLQLQAWLAETILYRVNQLPELNYIKFLQLLGVEQKAGAPARAELTFSVKQKEKVTEVLIEKGTVVGVSAADLEEPVFFETDETLVAIKATLALLLCVPGDKNEPVVKDVTQDNNFGGRSFAPFGDPPQVGARLLLGFTSELPFTREEFGLQIYLPEPEQGVLTAVGNMPQPQAGRVTGRQESLALAWEWWDGHDWEALEVSADNTEGLTQSGQVFFRVPGQIPAATESSLGFPVQAQEKKAPLLYWLRVRLRSPEFETQGRNGEGADVGAGIESEVSRTGTPYTRTPLVDRVLTNTVRATAARTVIDEAVGSSDGTPNQMMTLARRPVLAAPPLKLEIDEGEGARAWQAVPDFYGAGPSDAYYVLNRATGEIRFGDGRRGRVPAAGLYNVIARGYRYGGGRIGNVGAGTITELLNPVGGIEAVTNHRTAYDGEDEEALSDWKLRASREIKCERAVTLDDFAALAKEAPGALVARSYALVTSGSDGPTINVVIVPQSNAAKPIPGERQRRAVRRHLDARRLIATRLQVVGPTYHDIDVVIDLAATDNADLKKVKNDAEAFLRRYFQPITGGVDGAGWPFGRDVYYSELLREVMLREHVLRVDRLELLKFLPRPDREDGPHHFESKEDAEDGKQGLLDAEKLAFPATPGCEPSPAIIRLVVSAPTADGPEDARFYVAAAYDRCDLPVANGALVALRHAGVSVRYARGK